MDSKLSMPDGDSSEILHLEEKELNLSSENHQIPKSRGVVFDYLPEYETQSGRPSHSQKARQVQNMRDYDNPPENLPIIIREKELTSKQRTMTRFVTINNFSSIEEEVKKKETHQKIHKKATLEFVNHLANTANVNYERKKNQGVMFLNELWGKKYHQSVVTASGLRNAQYQIKGKSLKVSSERVKAVGKYYEDKHKDQIARERGLLEAVVVPMDNTDSSKELRERLDESRALTERDRFSTPRGEPGTRRADIYRSINKSGMEDVSSSQTPSPYRNRNPHRASTLIPTSTSLFGLSSASSKMLKTPESTASHQKTRKFRFDDLSLANQSTNEEQNQPEIVRRTETVKETDEMNSKWQNSTQLPPIDSTSPEKSKEYEIKGAKHHLPSTTYSNAFPNGSTFSSKSTFNTVRTLKKSQTTPIRQKFNATSLTSTKDSRNDIDATRLLDSKLSESHDFNKKSLVSTPNAQNRGSTFIRIKPFLSESAIGKSSRVEKSAFFLSNSKMNATSSPAGTRVKTEEIESLKNNFLNLVSYCEEVRADQEVHKAFREAQNNSERMFLSPREKKMKNQNQKKKQPNVDLMRTIQSMFSVRENRTQRQAT